MECLAVALVLEKEGVIFGRWIAACYRSSHQPTYTFLTSPFPLPHTQATPSLNVFKHDRSTSQEGDPVSTRSPKGLTLTS